MRNRTVHAEGTVSVKAPGHERSWCERDKVVPHNEGAKVVDEVGEAGRTPKAIVKSNLSYKKYHH